MTERPLPLWTLDERDPRAPSEAVWRSMTAAERERVVATLPSEFPVDQARPPEGDPHFNAKMNTRKTLERFFARHGRRVYLACELPVYYPDERMFAPDVMGVVDVEMHERMGWVVSKEERGLDFALEIYVAGDRRKDHIANVERYARLGIAEYFIFDRGRLRLSGYRLPEASTRRYDPILPQFGHYKSHVLGLELVLEGEKLRFFHGDAPVPEAEELIGKLEAMVNLLELRVEEEAKLREEETKLREEEAKLREEEAKLREEEAKLREEEAKLREEETKLREEAERKLAEALRELEALKRGSPQS